jgi:hypothetical protein
LPFISAELTVSAIIPAGKQLVNDSRAGFTGTTGTPPFGSEAGTTAVGFTTLSSTTALGCCVAHPAASNVKKNNNTTFFIRYLNNQYSPTITKVLGRYQALLLFRINIRHVY